MSTINRIEEDENQNDCINSLIRPNNVYQKDSLAE